MAALITPLMTSYKYPSLTPRVTPLARQGDLGLSLRTLAATAPQRSQFGKTGSLNKNAFSHESMTGSLSDNGRHDAEMYYRTVRPMEGRSVAIIKQGHWSQLY